MAACSILQQDRGEDDALQTAVMVVHLFLPCCQNAMAECNGRVLCNGGVQWQNAWQELVQHTQLPGWRSTSHVDQNSHMYAARLLSALYGREQLPTLGWATEPHGNVHIWPHLQIFDPLNMEKWGAHLKEMSTGWLG